MLNGMAWVVVCDVCYVMCVECGVERAGPLPSSPSSSFTSLRAAFSPVTDLSRSCPLLPLPSCPPSTLLPLLSLLHSPFLLLLSTATFSTDRTSTSRCLSPTAAGMPVRLCASWRGSRASRTTLRTCRAGREGYQTDLQRKYTSHAH